MWHVRNDDETAALAGCWPYGSDTKGGVVIVDRMKTNKRQNPAVRLQLVVSGANNSGPFLRTWFSGDSAVLTAARKESEFI